MLSQDKPLYQVIMGIPFRYALRWRFEYFDKPDAKGQWGRCGEPNTMAAYAPKEGISRVFIEGRDVLFSTETKFFSIPGWDFVNFEWIGGISPDVMGLDGSKTYEPTIIGARLVTRDKIYSVNIAGRILPVIERSETEKQRNYFCFGR